MASRWIRHDFTWDDSAPEYSELEISTAHVLVARVLNADDFPCVDEEADAVDAESRDLARRICACLNACGQAVIPTAALEGQVLVELIEAAREYLKGGRHDGPCTNAEGGACWEHLGTAHERKLRLEKALAALQGGAA